LAVFLEIVFEVFLTPFLALFTTRLLFAARFFTAAFLATFLLAPARCALRTFFALLFLEAFVLGVATTNSFMT
jgi:hypothetical protein